MFHFPLDHNEKWTVRKFTKDEDNYVREKVANFEDL